MNIRSVRKKIKSVSNVKKITKAMELVSAVKMKKAQEKAIASRSYQENLEKIMNKINSRLDIKSSPLLKAKTEASENLIVLVSSNKGLCGSFNANLFRFLLQQEDLKKCDFIIIGKKGEQLLGRTRSNIIADFSSNNFHLESVSAVINMAIDSFLSSRYSKVVVYFNQFISSLRVEPSAEVLLPVKVEKKKGLEKVEDYIIEPAPEEIIDGLLRTYIEERLRYVLIQSDAGEHSARMIAMKNATENADELGYELTLLRNKLRQQKITYELLDMLTAKESVGS